MLSSKTTANRELAFIAFQVKQTVVIQVTNLTKQAQVARPKSRGIFHIINQTCAFHANFMSEMQIFGLSPGLVHHKVRCSNDQMVTDLKIHLSPTGEITFDELPQGQWQDLMMSGRGRWSC